MNPAFLAIAGSILSAIAGRRGSKSTEYIEVAFYLLTPLRIPASYPFFEDDELNQWSDQNLGLTDPHYASFSPEKELKFWQELLGHYSPEENELLVYGLTELIQSWYLDDMANFPYFFDITRKGNDVTIKLKDEIWKDGDPHDKTEAIKIFLDFENQGDFTLSDLVSDLEFDWFIEDLEQKGWKFFHRILPDRGGYIKTMMIPEPLATRLINSVHSKDILIEPKITPMGLWK